MFVFQDKLKSKLLAKGCVNWFMNQTSEILNIKFGISGATQNKKEF